MLSIDRVKLALKHEKSDRVPTFFRRTSAPGYDLSEEKMQFINEVIDIGEYLNMRSSEGRMSMTESNVRYDELGIGY